MQQSNAPIKKVRFFSNHNKIGIETSITPNGTYSRTPLILQLQDFPKEEKYIIKIPFPSWKEILLTIAIVGIPTLLSKNTTLILTALLWISYSLIPTLQLIKILIPIYLDEFEANRSMREITELKAMTAYKNLGRIPTIQEIKKTKIKFGKENTILANILMRTICHSILAICMLLQSYFSISFYIAMTLVLTIIIIYAITQNFFEELTILLYRKPSKEYLELAITGLENLEELNKYIDEEYNIFKGVQKMQKIDSLYLSVENDF